MAAFRKWLIVSAVALGLLIGLWVYAYFAGPQWLMDFSRGGTRTVAQSMGVHWFDEAVPPTQTGNAPKRETVANLPDGYYLFMGANPLQKEPRWVVVNPGGTISWMNTGSATAQPATVTASAKPPVQVPLQGQFEEYRYPVIKWKAKPLPGPDGAIAQLHTTFEPVAPGQPGTVKYRLTLFKAPGNGNREVQLLDADGFKLLQFNVGDFHEIPGSQLMESRDSFTCDEEKYRQARDYSVN